MVNNDYIALLEAENKELKARLREYDDCESCLHDMGGKCQRIHTTEGCLWTWKGVPSKKE